MHKGLWNEINTKKLTPTKLEPPASQASICNAIPADKQTYSLILIWVIFLTVKMAREGGWRFLLINGAAVSSVTPAGHIGNDPVAPGRQSRGRVEFRRREQSFPASPGNTPSATRVNRTENEDAEPGRQCHIWIRIIPF